MTIDNIYKVRFENYYDKYYGFLRNEKKFSLGDDVFVSYGDNSIFRGQIRGIELSDDLNPEIYYKIEIPKGLVFDLYGKENTSLRLNCNYVFSSLDDAKESRIKQLNKMHALELQSIDLFFNQFKDDEAV